MEQRLFVPYPELSPAQQQERYNYFIGKDPITYFSFSKLREYQENPKIVRTFGVRTILKIKGAIVCTRPIMTSEQKEQFEPFYEDLVNEYDLLLRAGYDYPSDEPYQYVRRLEVIKKPCFFIRVWKYFADGTPFTFCQFDEERIVPDLRVVMEEERKQKKNETSKSQTKSRSFSRNY